MRIVIDMQGAQSSGSKNRGIGRYTNALVSALIRQRDHHDLVLALNGQLVQATADLLSEFRDQLPKGSLSIWRADGFVPYLHDAVPSSAPRLAAQFTYEAFLASLEPDIILVTSLFEGLVDQTITSIHRYQTDVPVACLLYDLIPHTNPAQYLENPIVKLWYSDKLEDLQRADLLLAISAYSRQEGIQELGLDPQRVVNISSDVTGHFAKKDLPPGQQAQLTARIGLTKPFIMYTGGADYRKNIEGLVKAFAALPERTRTKYQLAIICLMPDHFKASISQLGEDLGLTTDDLVLPGFVSDGELVELYNMCHLFVFPSFHEGFGLPALEAIRCGAPVIGSDRSSIPEVIGCDEALFDPSSTQSMATLMTKALTDQTFRATIQRAEQSNATNFSWDKTARRALAAMQQAHERTSETKSIGSAEPQLKPTCPSAARKLKMAFFSPLPPCKSGIADYSAMLLPKLAKHYDIDVICAPAYPVDTQITQAHCQLKPIEWFAAHFDKYDRVVYQFGNSEFHRHMFEWLALVPGLVVLHDFFLSGILADSELSNKFPGTWTQALYDSHGYSAVSDRLNATDLRDIIWRYPANLNVLQQALGVIVHTEHSRSMGKIWYGSCDFDRWHIVPLVRTPANLTTRSSARQRLGLGPDDFMVCSYGMISPTKLHHIILDAWQTSHLSSNPHAQLVFVGEPDKSDYGIRLSEQIMHQSVPGSIRITGWTLPSNYEDYLLAADMAIQLRTNSRGETSAAVLDCMNYGVPTIINAHGSMAELSPDTVYQLPDRLTVRELAEAIDQLAQDAQLRLHYQQLSSRLIANEHSPETCAEKYVHAIESTYADKTNQLTRVCRAIGQLSLDNRKIASASAGLSYSFPPQPRQPRCLLNVTHLQHVSRYNPAGDQLLSLMSQCSNTLGTTHRIEPVYFDSSLGGLRLAQKLTAKHMKMSQNWAADDPIEIWPSDILICFESQLAWLNMQQEKLLDWKNRGIQVWLKLLPAEQTTVLSQKADAAAILTFEKAIPHIHGVLCEDEDQLLQTQHFMRARYPSQQARIEQAIGWPNGSN